MRLLLLPQLSLKQSERTQKAAWVSLEKRSAAYVLESSAGHMSQQQLQSLSLSFSLWGPGWLICHCSTGVLPTSKYDDNHLSPFPAPGGQA